MGKFLHGLWKVITFPFRLIWWILTLPFKAYKGIREFLNCEPPDRPLAEAFAATIQKPSVLIEHIEALRRHLLRALIGLIIAVAISFTFTEEMVTFLAQGLEGGLASLQALEVTETIGVFMRVALLAGFALATPYIAFELWLFAARGLKPRARIIGLMGIPLVALFFVGGMAFTYEKLLPPALNFLRQFSMGVQVNWRLSSYIGFVTGILFWIGVAFEFPLVVSFLTLMGIVKPDFLLQQSRLAIVIIAILAAAVTPTLDPVNMMLVMAPMVALYFLGIGLSYLAAMARRKTASETS